MNNLTPNQTIIQQIQPQCDSVHLKIKEAKNRQGKTNQEIADNTGVPLSNIGKLLSGNLSNPNVFNVAAICIYLGLSLDQLMGIAVDSTSDEAEKKVAELEAQVCDLKNRMDIRELVNSRLEQGLKERTPVIYSLIGLCVLLTVSLIGYITIDLADKNNGLFSGNSVSLLGLLEVCAVVIAIIAIAVLATHKHVINKKGKEMMNSEQQSNS